MSQKSKRSGGKPQRQPRVPRLLVLLQAIDRSSFTCLNYIILSDNQLISVIIIPSSTKGGQWQESWCFCFVSLGCFPYVAELRWRSVMLLLLFFSSMECNAAYFCSHCMNHTGTQMIQTHIEPYNKLISSNIYGRLVYYKLLSLTHTHVIAIPIAAFNYLYLFSPINI